MLQLTDTLAGVSSPMLVSTSRIIYDNDFLDAGCPTDEYDESYSIDTTFATYSTNFLITIVCFLFAAKIMANKKSHENYLAYMSYFFIGVGIGFGVAGIGHVVFETNQDPGSLLVAFFTMVPNALGVIPLLFTPFRVSKISRVVGVFLGFLVVNLGVLFVVFQETIYLLLLQLFFIFLHLICAVIFFVQSCTRGGNNLLVKSFGMVIMLGSIAIQYFLTPTCGVGGYENCFRDCPLPAPAFNHNALFHILYAIGLIVLGSSEVVSPIIREEGIDDYEAKEEDEKPWNENP